MFLHGSRQECAAESEMNRARPSGNAISGGSTMRFETIRHYGRMGVVLGAILNASLALGQNANTGEIRGTVQDSSGAVVEGAKVTITNVDTGVSIVSTTTSAGLYDAPPDRNATARTSARERIARASAARTSRLRAVTPRHPRGRRSRPSSSSSSSSSSSQTTSATVSAASASSRASTRSAVSAATRK